MCGRALGVRVGEEGLEENAVEKRKLPGETLLHYPISTDKDDGFQEEIKSLEHRNAVATSSNQFCRHTKREVDPECSGRTFG